MSAQPSREHLYRMIESDISYALRTYAGFTDGGSHRDTEAWRHAPLPDLLKAVMVQLRAGLGPALSSEAVEAGVDWIRTNVPQEYIDAAINAAQGGARSEASAVGTLDAGSGTRP